MDAMSERLRAEFATMEPVYIDGIAGIFNLGENFATYYFRYGTCPERGGIIRVAALVLVRPRSAWPCLTNGTCKVARLVETPQVPETIAGVLRH